MRASSEETSRCPVSGSLCTSDDLGERVDLPRELIPPTIELNAIGSTRPLVRLFSNGLSISRCSSVPFRTSTRSAPVKAAPRLFANIFDTSRAARPSRQCGSRSVGGSPLLNTQQLHRSQKDRHSEQPDLGEYQQSPPSLEVSSSPPQVSCTLSPTNSSGRGFAERLRMLTPRRGAE